MENTFEEDYPEYCKEKEPPKPIWLQKYCVWIDGHICDDLHFSVNTNDMDKIGNLFDTKEEAEKSAEKLRAWKRLKDNGISFSLDIMDNKGTPYIKIHSKHERGTFQKVMEITHDLYLIFGGEDE